jgi:hypothetical protein
MNNFRFPSISVGYLGLEVTDSSLTSQFYAGYSRHGLAKPVADRLVFWPQRVPILGFFDELLECETPVYRQAFAECRCQILRQLEDLTRLGPIGPELVNEVCNTVDLAARYGLLEAVHRIGSSLPLKPETDLIRLKLFTYHNTLRHSRGEAVDLSELVELISACEVPLIRALAIARLIVILARYAPERWPKESARWHSEAVQFVESAPEDNGLVPQVWRSMIFRALPMARGIDRQLGEEWMTRSVQIVEGLPVISALDRVAQKELLCTTLQSVAKMQLANKQEGLAIATLEKLIALDPFDPVGYSETAFIHWRAERPALALPYFQRAIDLGPPAFAMNAHFAGLCRKMTGDFAGALENFQLSASADAYGLSPRLELLASYRSAGNLTEAARIQSQILSDKNLREQMTEEEVVELNRV